MTAAETPPCVTGAVCETCAQLRATYPRASDETIRAIHLANRHTHMPSPVPSPSGDPLRTACKQAISGDGAVLWSASHLLTVLDSLSSLRARLEAVDERVSRTRWDAYRAGFMDGAGGTPKGHPSDYGDRGYESLCAYAESRATAYNAARATPPREDASHE